MPFLTKIIDGVKNNAIITILGSSNAGKTTLARYLETGEAQLDPLGTTLGIDYRKKGIIIDDWKFNIIDVGGQKIFQDLFWDIAIQKSNAVIFVIDATIKPETNNDMFENQIEQFNYVVDILNDDAVLLILLNKQDLKELNPIQSTEFIKLIKSNRINSTTTGLLPISAKFGDGVKEAFSWLSHILTN